MTKTKASIDWFIALVKRVKGSGKGRERLRMDAFSPRKDPFIGGMFFFIYDAKHKETLEHWDAFPLVIPVEMYNDGFLGLNLHYLPPALREKLLNLLLKYSKRTTTPRAYMALSYSMLSKVVKSDLFEPCIHRYLTNHIKTELIKINHDSWMKAALLPVQKFQKKTARQVWRGK